MKNLKVFNTIAFDIGNVLVRIDIEKFVTVFNSLCYSGYLDTKIDPTNFLLDLHGIQDCGLTTVIRKARERLNWADDCGPFIEQELSNAWDSVIIINASMLNFLQELKKQKVSIALLSNMGTEHAHLFRTKYPEFFDGCVLHLSCEVGVRKPSKLYYQSFLMDHPEFKGCIYLDDRIENIQAGKEYGFDARHFDLENFLLLSEDSQRKYIDSLMAEILS